MNIRSSQNTYGHLVEASEVNFFKIEKLENFYKEFLLSPQ